MYLLVSIVTADQKMYLNGFFFVVLIYLFLEDPEERSSFFKLSHLLESWQRLFEPRIQQITSTPFPSVVSGLIARPITFPARNNHNPLLRSRLRTLFLRAHATFLLPLEGGTTIHDSVNVTFGLLPRNNKKTV